MKATATTVCAPLLLLLLLVLVVLGLLSEVSATPGNVYINGKCVDCTRTEGDGGIFMPPDVSSGMSYALTSGAALFGIVSCLLSWCLH